MDYAPPREQSVEEIARRIIHDEQIPLLLPLDYCEALFSSCANEETLRLLRSVYYRWGDAERHWLPFFLVLITNSFPIQILPSASRVPRRRLGGPWGGGYI